jgi:hypothetical protein
MKKTASMPCLSDESLKKLSKRLSKNTQNLTCVGRSHDIEPLFTVEINIKNERTGLLSTRKIYTVCTGLLSQCNGTGVL